MACSECVVERFCSYDCLDTAQGSYHPFDCAGVTVDKGLATHSLAFLEKLLTDVSLLFCYISAILKFSLSVEKIQFYMT